MAKDHMVHTVHGSHPAGHWPQHGHNTTEHHDHEHNHAQRKRNKHQHSFTHSKVQNESQTETKDVAVHNGLTLQNIKLCIGSKKKLRVENSFELYDSFSQGQTTSSSGLQLSFTDKYMFSAQDLVGAPGIPNSTTVSTTKQDWQQSLATTLINTINNKGAVIGGGPAADQTNQSQNVQLNIDVVVNSLHWEYSIFNNGDMAVDVTVYYLLAKQSGKATEFDPNTLWYNQLYVTQGGSSGQSAVPTGGTGTSGASGWIQGYIPLSSPLTCQGFQKAWKLLKVQRYVLAVGATNRATIEVEVNKKFNQQILLELLQNDSLDIIKGWTVVPLVVAKGATCAVVNTGVNYGTYAPVSLATMSAIKVHYGYQKGKGAAPYPQYIGSFGLPQAGKSTGVHTMLDTDTAATFITATGS